MQNFNVRFALLFTKANWRRLLFKIESNGDLLQATSHKGEKRSGYSIELKKEVIKYARENSARNAAIRFKIDIGWLIFR